MNACPVPSEKPAHSSSCSGAALHNGQTNIVAWRPWLLCLQVAVSTVPLSRVPTQTSAISKEQPPPMQAASCSTAVKDFFRFVPYTGQARGQC